MMLGTRNYGRHANFPDLSLKVTVSGASHYKKDMYHVASYAQILKFWKVWRLPLEQIDSTLSSDILRALRLAGCVRRRSHEC